MEWRMMKKPAAAAKPERTADDSSINGDEGGGESTANKAVGGNPVYSEENNTKTSSPPPPSQTDPTINKKEGQLESTKAAMLEVREENERLKSILGQIVKDYQSLQLHFFDIMKQEQANKIQDSDHPCSPTRNEHVEHELVSLCLGSGSNPMMKQKQKQKQEAMPNTDGARQIVEESSDDHMKESLTLSLDCKMEGKESEASFKNEARLSLSSGNSSEETATKEETVTGDTWPPSKALKGLKRGEDEAAPQAHVKRARVSVRARCDAPTMNDGCQWRKYGQKIAKGNPCPRAYYRCTVAPGCPVRKQVQRCCDDMSILITTYEGNHSHPLPTAATAMASTTAAAACMLTSGSSTSLSATVPSHSTSAAGLNFSLPDSSHPNRQFYFTNPSISPSPSQPTITLDLTNPSSAGQPLNRFSSSSSRSFYSPPANFSFSPSDSSSWSSRSTTGNYMSYAAHEPYYKSYNNMGALRQSQESLFSSYAQKNPLTDTIAKAITSDPTFQSALAAAITSYVGGSAAAGIEGSPSGGGGAMHGVLKWGEQLQLASSLTAAGVTAGVGNSSPGYLVGSASSSSSKQQGSLVFLPPTTKNNGPIGSPRNNS